jgi:hypothetical protein
MARKLGGICESLFLNRGANILKGDNCFLEVAVL